MKKTCFERGWFWLVASILFLVLVQVVYTIEAPCKWLEAKWNAGDIISFAGTIVLGFVAIKQTQHANRISYKLLELENDANIPLLEIKEMVGITKYKVTTHNDDFDGKNVVQELRDTENNVYLGYSFVVKVGEYNQEAKVYCRNYEMHCRYKGKPHIKSFVVKNIRFECDDELVKEFTLQQNNLMSLTENEEFPLFFLFVSNSDFLNENSENYKIVSAKKIILNIIMESFDEKEFEEKIVLVKHLVKEPEKNFNIENVEFLVSATYTITEKNREKHNRC